MKANHLGIIHDLLTRRRFCALPRAYPVCSAALTSRGSIVLREFMGRSLRGHLGQTLLVLDPGAAELAVPALRSGYACMGCGNVLAEGQVRRLSDSESSEWADTFQGLLDMPRTETAAFTGKRSDPDKTHAGPLTELDLEDPWFGDPIAEDWRPDEVDFAPVPKAEASPFKGAWTSWCQWLLRWRLEP